jgi:hypothetical protein
VEIQARLDRLTAEARRLKGIAEALGEDAGPAPIGIDEGVTGIRELAGLFVDAKNFTAQDRESVQNTIRRWIELHGDLPIVKWTREYLATFDRELRKLPASGRADVRTLPMREAIAKGEAEGLPPVVYKTRKRYSDHMKAMTKYALNDAGLLDADPFAGLLPIKDKVKQSTAKKGAVIAYTPAEVGLILAHCA